MKELVNGERFTAVEPTPLLADAIAHAAARLTELLDADGRKATVRVLEPWRFSDTTLLRPTITVAAEGSAVPELVIEHRIESTARYVLGPKRMAYARFDVPEVWFVDPYRQRIAALHTGTAGDGEYAWPPAVRGARDELEPGALPGLRVRGADLMRWPERRTIAGPVPDDWYDAS